MTKLYNQEVSAPEFPEEEVPEGEDKIPDKEDLEKEEEEI